jgi:hypothetical protein
MQRARGYVVVWILVLAALVTVAIAVATRGQDGLDPRRTWMILAAAVVVAGGIALELRRDPWDFAVFGAATGTIGAMIFGLVALVDRRPTPYATSAAIVSLAAAIAAGVTLWRLSRAADEVPNVLADQFGKGALLESDGVQLVVVPPAEVSAREAATLQLFLQNCFDAAREVSVRLESDGRARRLLYDPRPVARLGPLEVGVLAIPLRARPGPAGWAELVASVSADGAGGRRVRRWRARPATKRIRPWVQALAFVTGHLVWGGGIPIRLRIDTVPEGTSPPPLPAGSLQTLWAPAAREPLAAARASGLVRGAPRR